MNTTDSKDPMLTILIEAGQQFKSGIVVFDINKMEIIYLNELAESYLGSLPSIATNYASLLERIAPEHKEYVRSQVERTVREKRTSEIEFRVGSIKINSPDLLLCCTNYFLNRSNKLLIHITDITERKEQEDFLTEFGTKKNTTLETMTHHFSGALMLMQQLTKQAEESLDTSANPQLVEYLKLLSANTASCVAVMDNVLNEEHLKSPHIAVKKSYIDIVERVAFIFDNLKKAIPSRNISYEPVERSMYVYTDEFKVLQIINIFVSNAIKFTTPDQPIVISIYQTDNNIIIAVEDEGVGIPERLQPFLFKKKSEAGRIGLSGERSNGLGLSISKALAESMGARIEFETTESKGSAFYLLIPHHPPIS